MKLLLEDREDRTEVFVPFAILTSLFPIYAESTTHRKHTNANYNKTHAHTHTSGTHAYVHGIYTHNA